MNLLFWTLMNADIFDLEKRNFYLHLSAKICVPFNLT